MKKQLALLLALVMVLSLFAGCTNKESNKATDAQGTNATAGDGEAIAPAVSTDDEKKGGVLNLAWQGNGSDSLDPLYNTGWLTYIWATNVFETAISRDVNGNYVPCVCDFELSEDNMTLKLWVREGVTFHNGNPVTIEDVEYSLMTRPVGTTINIEKWFTNYVADYSIEDGVITFHFSEYNANTLYYLSGYATFSAIIPKEIGEKHHNEATEEYYITDLNDIIGTGPYKVNVENTELGRVVSLDRYEDYIPVEDGISGLGGAKKAYMDTINIFYNAEENSVAMSLMNGDYDVATVGADFAEMLTSKGLASTPDLNQNIAYICFNTVEGRPVADANLRKAIAAAIDYDQLMEVLYGKGFYTLDNCPMAQSTPYYTDAFFNADYTGAADLELSAKYLAESNYNGEPVVIAAKSSDKAAEVIEAMIDAAGINCEILFMDDASFTPYFGDTSNPYDIICASSAKCDSIPSSMVTNLRTRFWNDDEAAALFDAIGGSLAGSEDSLAAWETMYTKWVDDAHIIPLGTVQTFFYHDPDLVINSEGGWRYFFNAYWRNPEDHME